MYKNLILILFLSVLMSSCHQDPEEEIFHLTLGTESGAEVSMGLYSAEVTINGYSRWIDIGLVGNFDMYVLSTDIPSWMTVREVETVGLSRRIRVIVSELTGDESRVGRVGYTVFKEGRSQSGAVTITQNPCTLEDYRATEHRAIKAYLSKFDVVDELPPLDELRVGSVAPYYKSQFPNIC